MKTRMYLMVAGIAAGMGAGAVAGGGQEEVSYRIVAKTGDVASGGGGAVFSSFGVPRLNDRGEVAFQALLDTEVAPSGIWSEGQGGVGNAQLVARQGQAIPNGGGMQFGNFADVQFSAYAPVINNSGSVAFGTQVLGSIVNGSVGIVREVGGALERVALPGMIAPGTGGAFEAIVNLPSLSETNAVAFRARIGGFGVNSGNDTAIWTDAGGSLQAHMREGDIAPNTFNAVYTQFGQIVPRINGLGEVSAMNDVELGNELRWSLYMGAAGSPTLHVQEVWSTPLGISTEFDGVTYTFGRHTINDAGDILFPQSFEVFGQHEQGLWLHRNGVLEAVAATGTTSPIGSLYDVVFSDFLAINGDSDVVFVASTSGVGVTNETDDALFRKNAGGGAFVVFREGLQAPGAPAGVLIDGFLQATITNRGQVATLAGLRGAGVNASNDRALFSTRATFGARMLIREGQLMEVAPGDMRTVETFSVVLGEGPESGRPRGMNFNGQAALRVEFGDGTEAIVVTEAIIDCPGDFNGDLVVDFSDLNILLTNYGQDALAGQSGDVNLDGVVDFSDLNALLVLFGTSCLPPV